MNILQLKFLLVALALAISCPSTAQTFPDFFTDQRQMYVSKDASGDYFLALSALKKVNGVWLAENEQRVTGNVVRKTYELAKPYSIDSALTYIRTYFAKQSGQLVYECEGLDCGSSNAWANERFGVKQLYGLDVSQYYGVWSFGGAEQQNIASIYLVQRGNRRMYVQFDFIAQSSPTAKLVPSASVIAKTFYKNREIVLSGLGFVEGSVLLDEEYLQAYADAFNQQAFRKLVIQASDSLPGTLEQQRSRATAYANAVRDSLIKLGVHKRRITVAVEPTNTTDSTQVLVKIAR